MLHPWVVPMIACIIRLDQFYQCLGMQLAPRSNNAYRCCCPDLSKPMWRCIMHVETPIVGPARRHVLHTLLFGIKAQVLAEGQRCGYAVMGQKKQIHVERRMVGVNLRKGLVDTDHFKTHLQASAADGVAKQVLMRLHPLWHRTSRPWHASAQCQYRPPRGLTRASVVKLLASRLKSLNPWHLQPWSHKPCIEDNLDKQVHGQHGAARVRAKRDCASRTIR
mmetsp:Transcript_167117/g.536733  ORF Transcript_167117/g.536733 Transcript_167117/m.536733 type:complete len:221 (+) Transcript_167117:917-1579(+)